MGNERNARSVESEGIPPYNEMCSCTWGSSWPTLVKSINRRRRQTAWIFCQPHDWPAGREEGGGGGGARLSLSLSNCDRECCHFYLFPAVSVNDVMNKASVCRGAKSSKISPSSLFLLFFDKERATVADR